MKKKLSIIYQYYLLVGFKNAYLDALLTMALFIGLHLFILQEILIRVASIKKESGYISIFLSSGFVLYFCFGILLISLFIYTRQKLLETKFNRSDLKRGISKLLIYFGILFIVLLIMQNSPLLAQASACAIY